MKKRIEKYFPAAISAIETVLQKGDNSAVIDREHQAYISSFGASILQMGLLPTLAVFADKESGSAKDKNLLLHVLALTMTAENGRYLSQEAYTALKGKEDNLFKVAVQNKTIRKELTINILDATVAVKLCLRTFKLSPL